MAHHDNPGEMAIRNKQYKLIYFYGCDYQGGNQTPPAWELYDLQADPEEWNNLIDQPAYRNTLLSLKDQLATLRIKVGDDGSHYPACEAVVQAFWDDDESDRKQAREISRAFRERREAFLAEQGNQ